MASSRDISPAELLPKLRADLARAKESKNHEEAGKIRMQLWVCNDLAQGVKTQMPTEEYRDIVDSLPLGPKLEPPPGSTTPLSTLTHTERKIKTLQKKLDQITELKSQRDKGEEIQKNQLGKIDKEDETRHELKELEDIFRSVSSGEPPTAKPASDLINNGVTIDSTRLIDTGSPLPLENKLRNLNKRLKQIQDLKKRAAAGEILDDGQEYKIEKEDSIRAKIQVLQEKITEKS